MKLSGWGNYPVVDAVVKEPATINKLIKQLEEGKSLIPRGLGRSYGDSSLNANLTLCSLKLDSMISFNSDTGEFVTEPGVTFEDILDTFAPKGWFLPVTPGTKFITIGGAVASDVHGKNHHINGSFGNNVLWFEIWTSSEGHVRCSREENSDLFWATIGGHGLTGFITKVAIKLIKIPSVYIYQKVIKAQNLNEIMDIFEEEKDVPYSVAWIDCQVGGDQLGHSLFMGGDFASKELPKKLSKNPYVCSKSVKLTVPFNFPKFALNSATIKAFNSIYYNMNFKKKKEHVVTYDKFFYPLDSIHNWNRIYGKRGFLQYQFVIPIESSRKGLSQILKNIINIGTGSFLAVLKLFGEQPKHYGNISFPEKGYTLALDFPLSKEIFSKLNNLDKIVFDFGGRLYLTKDSRTSPEFFIKSYNKELSSFIETKHKWDKQLMFNSNQSMRLNITK